MRAKATKSVQFPKLGWGINAGTERELPEDKAAQEVILTHPSISKVAAKDKEKEKEKETLKDNH